MKHALKIESLTLTARKADAIVKALKDFLQHDLNFSLDRIDDLDCRSRDGFIPYSHNMGGIEAVAFMDQYNAEQWLCGFENSSKTLEKYYKYDIESFCESKKITEINFDDQDLVEEFDRYRSEDTESTVLFSADLMLTSETKLNIRLCVCVKDAPYHRQYDDKFEFNIEFKNVAELKNKLKALLKNKNVSRFSKAVNESF